MTDHRNITVFTILYYVTNLHNYAFITAHMYLAYNCYTIDPRQMLMTLVHIMNWFYMYAQILVFLNFKFRVSNWSEWFIGILTLTHHHSTDVAVRSSYADDINCNWYREPSNSHTDALIYIYMDIPYAVIWCKWFYMTCLYSGSRLGVEIDPAIFRWAMGFITMPSLFRGKGVHQLCYSDPAVSSFASELFLLIYASFPLKY